MIDVEKTGQFAYALVTEKFGSVRKASAWIGISDNAIYHWKNGSKMPSIDNLLMIAECCGMKVDDIIIQRGNDKDGFALQKMDEKGR